MKTLFSGLVSLAVPVLAGTLRAQVPQLINYQGRVAVGTANFDGSGQFRFALVNRNGTTTSWSNDGARYNPSANAWTSLPTANAPAGRIFHTAAWTGTDMIVCGGFFDGSFLDDTWSYTPGKVMFLYQKR